MRVFTGLSRRDFEAEDSSLNLISVWRMSSFTTSFLMLFTSVATRR